MGDQCHRTLIDYAIKPSDSESWDGRCPTAFPYLDKRITSDVMDGEARGFTVSRESAWLAIGEGAWVRSYDPVPDAPGRKYVTGTAGSLTNWSPTYQHLKLRMTCTDNPAQAWIVH